MFKLVMALMLSTPMIRALTILAYGDSLTYGWSAGGRSETPYANMLQQTLSERDVKATVHHWGGPGKTARELVDPGLGGPKGQNGIVTMLRKYIHMNDNSPLVCVILIGTNDLAQIGWGATPASIFSDIKSLHELAKGEGARTLAVTLPSNGVGARFPDAEKARLEVNERMRSELDVVFEFPFSFSVTSALYDADQLHFSPSGYEALGRALAEPIIKDFLPPPKGEDAPFDGLTCGAFKMQQLKGGEQQIRIAKFLAEREEEKGDND